MVEDYTEDWWADQPYYVEVWVEKAALLGVIEDVCDRYGVRYYASRGDDGKSSSYQAGGRFRNVRSLGRKPLVLHLADGPRPNPLHARPPFGRRQKRHAQRGARPRPG